MSAFRRGYGEVGDGEVRADGDILVGEHTSDGVRPVGSEGSVAERFDCCWNGEDLGGLLVRPVSRFGDDLTGLNVNDDEVDWEAVQIEVGWGFARFDLVFFCVVEFILQSTMNKIIK